MKYYVIMMIVCGWILEGLMITALQQKSLLKTKKSFYQKHNEGAFDRSEWFSRKTSRKQAKFNWL